MTRLTRHLPIFGGPLITLAAGYRDDSKLARHRDVLTFTSAPWSRPSRSSAPRSSNWLTPLTILMLTSSSASQRSMPRGSRNVADGSSGSTLNAPDVVRLKLDAVAHRFAAGSRIRIFITGGSHPR